jgi:hypothetical protein
VVLVEQVPVVPVEQEPVVQVEQEPVVQVEQVPVVLVEQVPVVQVEQEPVVLVEGHWLGERFEELDLRSVQAFQDPSELERPAVVTALEHSDALGRLPARPVEVGLEDEVQVCVSTSYHSP